MNPFDKLKELTDKAWVQLERDYLAKLKKARWCHHDKGFKVEIQKERLPGCAPDVTRDVEYKVCILCDALWPLDNTAS